MPLTAGAARRDITNNTSLFLLGYPHVERQSEGVHDRLWASALYLHDGDQDIILIAVDILFVHHRTANACRKHIAARTGVPVDRILISATHTHSGPVTATMLSWRDDPLVPAPDPEYMVRFEEGITAAAVAAFNQAIPAEATMTTALSDGVGCNRLDPEAPRDPNVSLLMVRRAADHQPVALQVIYGMHPTVLHEDSRLVSSDFPHYTRQMLEQSWPGITVLYHNGPSGNLSPRYHVRAQTFAEAERLGTRLGRQILDATNRLKPENFHRDLVLRGKTRRVNLPPRHFGSVEAAGRELLEAQSEMTRLQREKAPHGPLRTAECTVFGAEERLTLARAEQEGLTQHIIQEYNPVEIQVLRLGDTFQIGFPGECFVEYGLLARKLLPESSVICLANGELQGYIPTPEATGYEARLSFFEPDAGRIMVEAAVGLAGQL